MKMRQVKLRHHAQRIRDAVKQGYLGYARFGYHREAVPGDGGAVAEGRDLRATIRY